MGFKYAHTCPDIDKGIEDFKSNIEWEIDEMLDKSSPLLQEEPKKEFMKSYIDSIYNNFQNSFESVRKTNEDMRQAAELQIEVLEEQLADLEREASSELESLRERINELESQLE